MAIAQELANEAGVVRRTHSYAVWEITLKCNLACGHCGSRAGSTRVKELTTEECFDLVRQMAEVGITEVTLIGGEAYLRRDWLEIAKAITDQGMICSMTTGGYGISRSVAAKMREAGLSTVSVSVDGMQATHDELRGRKGSWEACFRTLGFLREEGIYTGANSQINRLSAPEYPLLYEELYKAGVRGWQWSMTVPMGNAVENNRILLQPAELLDVFPMLALVVQQARRDGVAVQPGNNVGYYGPYERLLRNVGDPLGAYLWQGCKAGLSTIGIEADGAIKGCPSLPTAAYKGGSIRERSLHDIVTNAPELNINQHEGTPEGTSHLWGFCQSCEYAEACRGGCTWTSHVFFDKPGNNPYCHHRALVHAEQGLRERVKQIRGASGLPFDNGVFELRSEPLEAAWEAEDELHFTWESVQWPERWDPTRQQSEEEELT